jgi:hypothetical protein
MAYKNPQDKTDYQREYMRRRRAAAKRREPVAKADTGEVAVLKAELEQARKALAIALEANAAKPKKKLRRGRR